MKADQLAFENSLEEIQYPAPEGCCKKKKCCRKFERKGKFCGKCPKR